MQTNGIGRKMAMVLFGLMISSTAALADSSQEPALSAAEGVVQQEESTVNPNLANLGNSSSSKDSLKSVKLSTASKKKSKTSKKKASKSKGAKKSKKKSSKKSKKNSQTQSKSAAQ